MLQGHLTLTQRSYRDSNMPAMSVTLYTLHFERSPLNVVAPSNMPNMLVTLDTSHDPIGPFGP